MEQLKAYKFRIYPTEEQEIFFAKSFGCVRKVYNRFCCKVLNLLSNKVE
ncbi:transposase [Enterococcus hirae]|nr:transposase [Enterococcus hirae]